MANVERLLATLERIEANLNEWDQRYWCYRNESGTTMCFGGHAATLAGDPPLVNISIHGEDLIAHFTVSRRSVSAVARQWLDLDPHQVNELFYGDVSTITDLRRLVHRLVREARARRLVDEFVLQRLDPTDEPSSSRELVEVA